MTDIKLTKTRLFEGVWEGVLSAEGDLAHAPDIAVTHQQEPVEGVEVIQDPERARWVVRVPVPPEKISDGVQTFVIRDRNSGAVLDSFALLAGDALSYDIRAEMALLREELDLLKRAFRRHCLETG